LDKDVSDEFKKLEKMIEDLKGKLDKLESLDVGGARSEDRSKENLLRNQRVLTGVGVA